MFNRRYSTSENGATVQLILYQPPGNVTQGKISKPRPFSFQSHKVFINKVNIDMAVFVCMCVCPSQAILR